MINKYLHNFLSKETFSSAISGALVVLVLVIILNFSLSIFNSYAASDNELTYHGKLTDTSNVAVADGDYSFKISIYSVASGGTPIWTARGTTGTPTAKTVAVQNGVFTTTLGDSGDNSLDNITFDSNYYLGVTIGSNSEMTPRRKITPTGFALNSHRLNSFQSAESGADA
ncbi:MAG: hypothetical protein ABFQ53_01750, partial [Patescibacteria group bacterium]